MNNLRTPKELTFGPSGIPYSTPVSGIKAGIEQVAKLGLKSNELAFVRNVFLKPDAAREVAECAKKNNVFLTAHASYFVNLNAFEEDKVLASRQRILNAARITHIASGWSVVFHAAYYLESTPQKVYDKVKLEVKNIVKTLQDEGNNIWIRPETTGKATQFGELLEILKLSEEVEQVMPCIDFSHLHARTNGKENTYPEFARSLELVEKYLGKEGLSNMHIHTSGINYGPKGEKNHLILKESDMNYVDLMKAFRDFKIKGSVVCESPNQEDDALLMQKEYQKI